MESTIEKSKSVGGTSFRMLSQSGNTAITGSHNQSEGMTVFSGVSSNNEFFNLSNGDSPSNTKAIDFLIRAVNNRTRERNYFRLYIQLLEEEITDEDFDKEIDLNEDDYVVSNNEEADMEDIKIALSLCGRIKDVKDVDDMADLFSFSDKSIRESLVEK